MLESNIQIASLTGFNTIQCLLVVAVFGPLCKHHLDVRNTLKLAQLQLSVNAQFVALMHIITKNKLISSKNITSQNTH